MPEVIKPVGRKFRTYLPTIMKAAKSLNSTENIPIVRVPRYLWSKVDKVWPNIIGWFINKFKKTKSTLKIRHRIIVLRPRVISARLTDYRCRRKLTLSIRIEQEIITVIMCCIIDLLHMLNLMDVIGQPTQVT